MNRQRIFEVVFFVVIAVAGFICGKEVIQSHAQDSQIQILPQKPSPIRPKNPFMPNQPETPWTFGPPPQNLFDLPFTTLPPEPGSPAWYNSLPPIPPCRQPWHPEFDLPCKRVLNYI